MIDVKSKSFKGMEFHTVGNGNAVNARERLKYEIVCIEHSGTESCPNCSCQIHDEKLRRCNTEDNYVISFNIGIVMCIFVLSVVHT